MRISRLIPVLSAASLIWTLSACSSTAKLPLGAGEGPSPQLPPPEKSIITTANVAKATGWSEGAKPVAAQGLQVAALARDLSHPRWLYVLPNGDVLVAETNAPPKPDDSKGVRGFFQDLLMKRAGSKRPAANRITLLRGAGANGSPAMRTAFLQGLNSPFGMALVGDTFYVADTDAVMKFHYNPGDTQLSGPGEKLTDLPAGTINHHWTKNLIPNSDGSKLYVTVGSNSNVAENGIAAESERACIWEVDTKSGAHRVFASGLRNPNGLGWEPDSKILWTAVNERDELGSDLVPDYMTSVADGGFYGWPYSYYGAHIDERVQPQRPDLVAKALVPDYALGPHTASLGLAFASGDSLPERFRRGVFIGQHGSWNRKPLSGYRVIFIPFANGKPSGTVEEVLTGFVNDKKEAWGRPVGVAMDSTGALLVADDVGNTVWRISAAGAANAATGLTQPNTPTPPQS